MAKTSVKHVSAAQRKLIPLRRNRNWAQAQLASLPEKLDAEKQQRLSRLGARLDRKLQKAAFAACDKQAYAQNIMDQKLAQYDVEQYLRYRAVNHSCAKAIFAAVRKYQNWKPLLDAQEKKIEALQAGRAKRIQVLERQKANFLAKHSTSDPTCYEAAKAQLLAAYGAQEQVLTDRYARVLEKKSQVLTAKIAKYDEKTAAIKASLPHDLTLPEDVLLRVQGLKMYFGGLKAVDDLTFDVKKGEIFGLIGPNGAGKTTVFNCITRFYNATAGDMYFENNQGEVVDLRSFRVHDVIMQGITRTFQNVELVREISVTDNLLMACTREYRSNLLVHVLGLPSLRREEALLREKAVRILKFMGLESYAQWPAMGLPYGVLKKVEIARALMTNARLIIMDEPAAGLNDSETAELTRLIRRIRDEFHVTILLVEHDMSLVMNVCDTVCAISFGQLLAIGSCEEIKRNKAVQEAYLGVEEDG